MPNGAIYGNYAFYGDPDTGWVAVNGTKNANGLPTSGWVMDLVDSGGSTGYQRAATVADRLNAIFGDSNRDLDFVLPIVDTAGSYMVGCPLVRKTDTNKTAFYGGVACGFGGACGDGTEALPFTSACDGSNHYMAPEDMHKVYAGTSNNPATSSQELIVTVTAADKPDGKYWERALEWANNIRGRLAASGTKNVLGNNIQLLVSNGYANLSSSLSHNPPITEANPGCDITCCASDYSGVVYHPQENNCASSNIGTIGVGKWVKITSSATGKSVVCRLTDMSPVAVEVSYQAWRALGQPGSGTLTMSNV